jgi:hypothetical protein
MTELRLCRHRFTDEEVRKLGAELAQETEKLDELTSVKTQTTAAWTAERKTLEASIRSLAGKIRAGSEHRDIECEILLDTPSVGQKSIVRRDSGETVAVELMAGYEKQDLLPFQEVETEPEPEK